MAHYPAQSLQIQPGGLGQDSMASHRSAAYEVNVNMLRATFICVPAPVSPAWMTTDAQCLERRGLIRSYTSRSAPTIVASSPFAAAAAPPLTGASTM